MRNSGKALLGCVLYEGVKTSNRFPCLLPEGVSRCLNWVKIGGGPMGQARGVVSRLSAHSFGGTVCTVPCFALTPQKWLLDFGFCILSLVCSNCECTQFVCPSPHIVSLYSVA